MGLRSASEAFTTANEAFQKQVKAFFRNVIQQTARNAKLVAHITSFVKLCTSALGEAEVGRGHRERLQLTSGMLLANPLPVRPLLSNTPKKRATPPTAGRKRKKPRA